VGEELSDLVGVLLCHSDSDQEVQEVSSITRRVKEVWLESLIAEETGPGAVERIMEMLKTAGNNAFPEEGTVGPISELRWCARVLRVLESGGGGVGVTSLDLLAKWVGLRSREIQGTVWTNEMVEWEMRGEDAVVEVVKSLQWLQDHQPSIHVLFALVGDLGGAFPYFELAKIFVAAAFGVDEGNLGTRSLLQAATNLFSVRLEREDDNDDAGAADWKALEQRGVRLMEEIVSAAIASTDEAITVDLVSSLEQGNVVRVCSVVGVVRRALLEENVGASPLLPLGAWLLRRTLISSQDRLRSEVVGVVLKMMMMRAENWSRMISLSEWEEHWRGEEIVGVVAGRVLKDGDEKCLRVIRDIALDIVVKVKRGG